MNYTEPAYDDTICATCGAALPADPKPDTWQFHGFCTLACALRSDGGFHLIGRPALEMAEFSGRSGGPGFERDLLRDWVSAATPNAPPMLGRFSGEADIGPAYSRSWVWRLYAGGSCRFMRLTAKF